MPSIVYLKYQMKHICRGECLFFAAISECSTEEKRQCDPANSETLCSKDAASGHVKCTCPKGYIYNKATLMCDGKKTCEFITSIHVCSSNLTTLFTRMFNVFKFMRSLNVMPCVPCLNIGIASATVCSKVYCRR